MSNTYGTKYYFMNKTGSLHVNDVTRYGYTPYDDYTSRHDARDFWKVYDKYGNVRSEYYCPYSDDGLKILWEKAEDTITRYYNGRLLQLKRRFTTHNLQDVLVYLLYDSEEIRAYAYIVPDFILKAYSEYDDRIEEKKKLISSSKDGGTREIERQNEVNQKLELSYEIVEHVIQIKRGSVTIGLYDNWQKACKEFPMLSNQIEKDVILAFLDEEADNVSHNWIFYPRFLGPYIVFELENGTIYKRNCGETKRIEVTSLKQAIKIVDNIF